MAFALIVGYVLSLVYQFTNPAPDARRPRRADGPRRPGVDDRGRRSSCCSPRPRCWRSCPRSSWTRSTPSSTSFGLSPFFVGVVLIPTIGNLAEHLVAVQLAAKTRWSSRWRCRYGSSLQVALFVGPVLVLLGVVIGQPMDLVFPPLEVAAVAAAVGISALIALDGESNWLEGALLMIVYVILAFSFYEFVAPVGQPEVWRT